MCVCVLNAFNTLWLMRGDIFSLIMGNDYHNMCVSYCMNIHNDARMFSLLRRSGSIKSVFVFATAFIVVHGGRRMALDPNSATVAVDIVLVILGEEYLMSDHAVQKSAASWSPARATVLPEISKVSPAFRPVGI